jgi:hypothetical protein
MTKLLRVGVVGCGVIAQVMHLPHLLELDELCELTALCVLSEPTAQACALRPTTHLHQLGSRCSRTSRSMRCWC